MYGVLIGLAAAIFLVPSQVQAQALDGLSLSVTPTLFEMSAVPSQVWNSNVKVINNNKYPITVYAQVANFAPQGEQGEGKFIPVLTEVTEGSTLAEWIKLSNEPFIIEPEKSTVIPFVVTVPEGASPGGHFAAIMVGTKPPEIDGVIKVATSQIVTSLFFVRVAGDVIEDGQVREFRVTKSIVDTPKADFEVRFENKGNVHVQPQGEIVITNMWGKERGIIPINLQTHFGNVLPNSIRKFEFSWQGEYSFSDIGRYKADLTLSYGDGEKKFATSRAYFYIIPFKAGLILLSSLVLLVLFVRFAIKSYVRRMLLLAGIEPEVYKQKNTKSYQKEGDVRIVKHASVRAPVLLGVSDLKEHFKGRVQLTDKAKGLVQFVVLYKTFFFLACLGIISIIAVTLFFISVTKSQRDYEIVIDNADTDVTLSSEQILYNKDKAIAKQESVSGEVDTRDQLFKLILVNSSDTPGVAAALQKTLESKGYVIEDLQSDFEKSKETSVVVYSTELQEQALDLSKYIGGALLSARPEGDVEFPTITLFIGNDYVQ